MVDSTSEAPEALIGSVVAHKFEVVSFLDRGSIGAVYLAIQRPIGREVVLKVLRPTLPGVQQTDPDFAARFRREAETYGKLRHANTVTLFDYGEDRLNGEPLYFMALEYVRGVTLRAMLRRDGRLPAVRAVRIAVQIARSLREAHGHGIVHRDLKPGNVMILEGEEGDVVKVLDFGIAKVRVPDSEDHEAITRVGVLLGSPGYMAPEQIRSGVVDPRTDIYALGCVMFQMLTGVPPFRSDSPIDTCTKHLTAPVPSLDEAAGGALGVPGQVEAIVRRCLEKRPEDRFQTADDLLFALHALTDPSVSGSIHLVRTQAPAPPRRPQRSAAVWIAVGLLIAAVPALALGIIALIALMASLSGPGAAERGGVPAPAPPEVVAPTPVPQAVPVTIRSTPAGAEVWDGPTRLGTTPFTLEAPPAVGLVLRLAGHEDQPVDWAAASGAGEAAVVLVAVQPAPAPAPDPRPAPKPPPKPEGFTPDVRTER